MYLFDCDDVLAAEFVAIREGLMLALLWSNLPIDVESDSLEVVKMVQTNDINRSIYAYLIRDQADDESSGD